MYQYILITVSSEQMRRLQFANATLTYKKDGWYMLVYCSLQPLQSELFVRVQDDLDKEQLMMNGWQVARDFKIVTPNTDVTDFLHMLYNR